MQETFIGSGCLYFSAYAKTLDSLLWQPVTIQQGRACHSPGLRADQQRIYYALNL
jgi:hypothetical protein